MSAHPDFATTWVDDEREQLRQQLYVLIEAVQAGDADAGPGIDALAAEASRRGWSHLVRLSIHAQAVRALTEHDPALPKLVDELMASAERDADVVMLALALAWRSAHAVCGSDPAGAAPADADLARASVLLESVPDSREAAAAHVSCAISYTERRLWEIADEHYQAAQRIAASATDRSLPGLLMYNRAEIQLRWACALVEVGFPDGLEEHCRLGLATVAAARGTVKAAGWKRDLEVMALVLEAISGTDARPAAARLLADGATASEFTGHLHLAAAISERAAGEPAAAAREALAAADAIDPIAYPGEHDLALRLAVELESEAAGGSSAGLRYAQRQGRLRWGDRLSALGTMRARLETVRRSAEFEQLTRQARLDPLTGLANRRGLDRYLETLRRSATLSVAVIAVDLDHLKPINDTHGHLFGDLVLIRTAEILRSHVRSADDLVARLGGDEFLLILADADASVARSRANDIHRALAASRLGAGRPTTVSMGLAVGPADRIDALIARGDRALYQAKTRGRNCTVEL